MYKGAPSLSFIVTALPSSNEYAHGAGIILDSTYSVVNEISHYPNNSQLNMHELQIDGSTALFIHDPPVRHPDSSEHKWGFEDSGFVEIDLSSMKVVFAWDSSQHILRNTSTRPRPPANSYGAWDWL